MSRSFSSASYITIVYMVVFAALALLATTPMRAEAGCTYECASINTKLVFCGRITDTMPTIGVDASLDKCICTQENVALYRGCLACRDLNNAINATNKFISDCKINNQNIDLANGAFSHMDAIPSSIAYVAVMAASIGLAAVLGH
ncbi:hypothetical protein BGZ51_008334 [Haplosporangium sp. Z 767]|nr:hypothetical protein BGZ51_008334 [Haplosporangium sp. Z 767]KAF9192036.1 hypothetical protein BGZ50_008872 [Haplosporangium sp. Z 11]